MSNLEKVLKKLDELISFYDPSQPRDESGKWSGSGGESSGKRSYGTSFISEQEAGKLKTQEKTRESVVEKIRSAKEEIEDIDEDWAKGAVDETGFIANQISSFVEKGNSDSNFYDFLSAKAKEVANIADRLAKNDSKQARSNSDVFSSLTETIREIGEVFRENTREGWYKKKS